MDVKEYLKRDITRALDTAREITVAAEAEGRDLTEDESTTVSESVDLAKSKKAELKSMEDAEELRKQVSDLQESILGPDPVVVPSNPKTMGDAFVKSEAYARIKSRGTNGQWTSGAVQFKVAGEVLESTGQNSDAVLGTQLSEVQDPGFRQFPLTVADLLGTVQVTQGNSVTYPVVTGRTPQASGTISEGAPKPAADFTFDSVTETLEKIAAFIKVSEEMLEDAPAIAQYINNQLPLMVRQSEEAYLAAALYADADGSVDGSGVDGDNGFDAVLEAITVIRTAGFEPDGLLITPLDWARLVASKPAAGDGHYFGGGPFGATNNPWGLRVVVTPSATAGLPLVGAFKAGATVYRKGGVSLEATNSNEDDFRNNLVAIRAEERMVEGTTYPEAFCTADIVSGS
jgi:HK97 family phage major capsid protein